MKKTLSLLLTLALMMSCCLVPPALAADTAPRVRVNGTLVEFPDQGPVIDANSRTLVPVRFATEALGADVQWDHGTKTATISKGGASVAVTIGKREIAVTKGGASSTVAMDTEAVLLGGRTMVPIRYVAEALGAYVDYSARHRVVGIYQGELTPEQIAELQKLDMTFDSNVINEDDNNALMLPANSGSWADLREDLYAQKYAKGNHYYHDLEKYLPAETSAEYYTNLITDAKAAIEYHSDNLDVDFATDPSCIYQQIKDSRFRISVRGYVTVTPKINVNDMTGGERYLTISLLHMPETMEGKVYAFPIDAHVLDVSAVQLHEVQRLDGVDNTIK